MGWSTLKKIIGIVAPIVSVVSPVGLAGLAGTALLAHSPKGPAAKVLKNRLTNKLFYESSDKPKFGDVIFVNRCIALYRHFGIYIGYGKVIHFAAPNGDFDARNAYIHETSLSHFSDGSKVYVMKFPSKYESSSALRNLIRSSEYELQTPKQTVARAKSMLGRRGLKDAGYSVVFNNCEDFAIWCKTNVAESKQINELLDPFFPF